jgi:Flp pilus assembly pilin Flp
MRYMSGLDVATHVPYDARSRAPALRRQSEGVDLVEYALLGAFVAIAAYRGVRALGESLGGFYSGVVDSVVTQVVTAEGTVASRCAGLALLRAWHEQGV